MRVVTQNGQPVEWTSNVENAAPAQASTAAPAAATAPADAPLASSALAPAKAALAEMPEIDQAKVDALRDALANGEITFDADRLAGLIRRYHGDGV